MREYEFTLTFDLAASALAPDDLVEALGDHGCDDAIAGIGRPGRLALAFTRGADSATAAVFGAIRDAKRVLPGALLLEAAPDYVGITEVAEIVGRSRQNIRKLMLGSGGSAPAPMHEGSSAIWHLATLLRWLRDEKRYRVADDLLELASANMQVNVAIDQRNADPPTRDQIEALLA